MQDDERKFEGNRNYSTLPSNQLEQDIDSLVLDNFYVAHDQQREKVKTMNVNWDAFSETYLNTQTLKLVKIYDKADEETRLAQLQKVNQIRKKIKKISLLFFL